MAAIQNAVLNPAIEGGCLPFKLISAATTNSTLVKAGKSQLYGYYLSNIGTGPAYIKLYDKVSAPTVGTDVPVLTLMVPGSSGGAGAGATTMIPQGVRFLAGLGVGITGAAADNDTTAVAANEVVVNLVYL